MQLPENGHTFSLETVEHVLDILSEDPLVRKPVSQKINCGSSYVSIMCVGVLQWLICRWNQVSDYQGGMCS